jgi:hypothetical protein
MMYYIVEKNLRYFIKLILLQALKLLFQCMLYKMNDMTVIGTFVLYINKNKTRLKRLETPGLQC